MRAQLDGILAHHTGQTCEKIHLDTERDNIMMASEAMAYGLVDSVLESRKAEAKS